MDIERKRASITLELDQDCRAFFGHGDPIPIHCGD